MSDPGRVAEVITAFLNSDDLHETRRLVAEGSAATQTYDVNGTPEIAVGIPLLWGVWKTLEKAFVLFS